MPAPPPSVSGSWPSPGPDRLGPGSCTTSISTTTGESVGTGPTFPGAVPDRSPVNRPPTCSSIPCPPSGRRADLPSTTRFIVLLRDPVERAISQYWLNRRRNHETESFRGPSSPRTGGCAVRKKWSSGGGQSLQHDRYSYVARGHYAEQLNRWFHHVPRHRFLVVQSEELFASPDVANGVLDWLGSNPPTAPSPRAIRRCVTRQPTPTWWPGSTGTSNLTTAIWRTCWAAASGPRDRGSDPSQHP